MTRRRLRITGRALADLIVPLGKMRSRMDRFMLLTITFKDCGA